jgi:hypothetical protein
VLIPHLPPPFGDLTFFPLSSQHITKRKNLTSFDFRPLINSTAKKTTTIMGFTIRPSSATALTGHTSLTDCVNGVGVSMLLNHCPQQHDDPSTLNETLSVSRPSPPRGKQLQYSRGGFRRTVLRKKGSSSSAAPSSPSSLSLLNSRRSKSATNETTHCIDIIETALVELNKPIKQDEQQRPSLLSSKQKKARRVRFAPISEHQFIPSTLFNGLSKKDIQNGWWTSHDTEKTCQEQRELVRVFQISEPRAMSDYCHLLKLCLSESNEKDLQNPLDKDVFLVLPMVTKSMRGLEADVAPSLKKIRLTYRREVLKCAANVPQNVTRDLRDRILAARSATLSLPIRRLARVTGAADATEC